MTVRYRRIPQNEPEEIEETNKKMRAERMERISSKLHAFVWILVAAFIIYYTNMVNLLFSDKINRYALGFSCFFLSGCFIIFLYLGFWLPIIQKIDAPWEIYCPNMIPLATGFSVCCFISCIMTFWPVWGFLSPLFISLLTIGFIFTAHFIPWPC